jgi:predicted PurR-regulated permease PerM
MDEDRTRNDERVEETKSTLPAIETRITDFVRLGIVGLFAYWSLTLIAPFAIIAVWASILTVALFPAYARLRAMLGGRGRLAALLITLINLAIIIGPLAAILFGSAEAAQALFTKFEAGGIVVPSPAESVRDWPLIGERVYANWMLASNNLDALIKQLEPSLLQMSGTAVGLLASIGAGLLSFVVAVLVSGFLFRPGPRIAETVKTFAERIAGQRGLGFVKMTTSTIRNVARGVIGVALIQAFLCAIVLRLFDVPMTGLIAFAVLILCIVQIGPAPVLLPLIIWGWFKLEVGPALILTLLLVPIALIDNIMKPILVARGLSTPMLVILIGVLGGTLSYGLIGLFLGPIVLSVFYDLLLVWLRAGGEAQQQEPKA